MSKLTHLLHNSPGLNANLIGFFLNGVFPQPFVWRNDISTDQGNNYGLKQSHNFSPRAVKTSFLHTKGCGNISPIILINGE